MYFLRNNRIARNNSIEYSIRKEIPLINHSSHFLSYYPLIYCTLKKSHLPPPYEDYVQDAYFIYKKCLDSYDPSLCRFSTYFYYHLSYYYKSIIRKAVKPNKATPLLSHHNPFLDFIYWYDIYTNYSLTPREKHLLTLSLKEYTIPEIELHLRISASTIKRLRKSIRQKLLPLFDDDTTF